MKVTVGKVSTRKDAREHLDILGRAHCGAGNGRTMAATRWTVDATVNIARVCRRCLKALRTRLAEAAAGGDEYAASAATMLAPADPRADDALIADIRAHLRNVHTPPPTPAETLGITGDEYRRRLLAELAA